MLRIAIVAVLAACNVPVTNYTGVGDGPVLPTDLIAWYRFDNEQAGMVADASGHDHAGHCEYAECPNPVSGYNGTAAAFDGVNDHFHVPSDWALTSLEHFTVAVWIYVASPPPKSAVFAKLFVSPGQLDSWNLEVEGTAIRWITTDGLAPDIYQPGATLPIDRWVLFVATYDGAIHRFYLDRVQIGVHTLPGRMFDDGDLIIGADNANGTDVRFFPGNLDEIRIYSRVLSPAEVAALP